jgi:simple sugar transport system permease protein
MAAEPAPAPAPAPAAPARPNGLQDRLLDAFTSSNGLISLVVVLLGFLVGTLLIVLVGRNPAAMYSAIVQVLTGYDLRNGNWIPRYIGEWLTLTMPLVLCGLSMAFAARTGLFNIGAEGQYIAGLTAAQFVAIFAPPIPVLHWLLALAAALAAGGAWGGIVGWLKAKYAVSEVVATIMLNYVAFYLSRMLTVLIPGTNTNYTPYFGKTALLSNSWLSSATAGSDLNNGLWFTLLAALTFWLILEKTRFGFGLRATGLNKEAARCSGVNVNRATTSAMAIAGAFAGLAGAIVALGSFKQGRVLGGQDGYGFDGIAVALVGNSTAGGSVLAGLLFGLLKRAQSLMEGRQIPKEIAAIIKGLIVVFISLRAGVVMLVEWRQKESAKAGRTQE